MNFDTDIEQVHDKLETKIVTPQMFSLYPS
jgi:hypothetical protein